MKKLKNILIMTIVIAGLVISTKAYAADDENSPFVMSGTSPNNALSSIGFIPYSVTMDSTQDVAYITEMGSCFLYRADLNTGEMSYLVFKYKPSRMIIRDGNMYVILYHGQFPTSSHAPPGTVVVIDTSTFTMTSYFDIINNPYDLEMDDDGFLYISSGFDSSDSTFDKILSSYNPVTGELVSTSTIDAFSYLEYNSQNNKLYALCASGSPHKLSSYELSNGVFTSIHPSPYNYEYSAGWPMIISPDKQLLFAGGNIFNSSSASSDDMAYHDTIDSFSSIAFDNDSGVFYTVDKEDSHNLMTYDYSSLTATAQFIARYSFVSVFNNNDKLVYLQKKTYESGFFFTFSPEKSLNVTDVTGVSLDNDVINIMPGDRERLVHTITPSNPSIKSVTWYSSDPSVATYDDYEVFGHSAGTCVITVTTLDGGYTASCVVNVSSTPYVGASETSINALENLEFTPLDIALDPNDKIAYLTEVGGNKLYRVDLVSGDVRYMEFVYNAEHLTIRNDGELYLSLGRTYYSGYQYESGEIIVIDTDTFTMSEYIDMPNTPKDIITDGQQFLYVNCANNVYGIVTYDTNTWEQINNQQYTATNTISEYNKKYNKIYSVSGGSPEDLYTYRIKNGIITNISNSPYHGDYEMNSYIKISPDGEYIFNSTGNIFTCAQTVDGDMLFYNNIDSFTAVCFDESNSKFYTCSNNILKEYSITDQSFVKSYMTLDEIYDVFYEYGEITAIQVNSAGNYYFSTIDPLSTIDPYVATGTSPNNGLTNLGFVPKDIAIDYTEGAAYLTEVDGKKIYKVNLSTGEMQYMEFVFTAESITVRNGKVYVSLLHRPHSSSVSSASSGTIAIVDSATFIMDDYFVVEVDPYDIEVDNQGIAYIGPGSNQFSSVASYDTATGEQLSSRWGVSERSLWDYNQRYNKLYSISVNSDPRDIDAYEIEDGIITNIYDSPYHGQYAMSTYMRVSPDGRYIFNGSGNIFTGAPERDGDMIYVGNIESFSSICFDIKHNVFYTAKGNTLSVYCYASRSLIEQYTASESIIKIFYGNDQLVYLQANSQSEYFFAFEPEVYIEEVAVTGVTLSADSLTLLSGNKGVLNTSFAPINSTNHNVEWSTSNPSVATVEDGIVYANSTGTCEITVTAEDGGYTASCTVSVLTSIDFVPNDIAIDPDRLVAYMTEGKKLYRLDLATGDMTDISFQYVAESIALANGNVYVALLHRAHTYYLGYGNNGSGTIAVIDTETFTLTSSFDIGLDPYDIEVDNNGIAYIGPGSNQWSIAASYNTVTGKQLSSIDNVSYLSLWDYNEQYNKLYSISTTSSPRDIDAYEIINGKIINSYDSPYHGDYSMEKYMRISPDGRYIFNGSGNIFTCSPTKSGDMIFDEKIHSFSSICFDLDNNNFYVAEGNLLLTYEYNTLDVENVFTSKDEFVEIFWSSNELVFFQMNSKNQYFFTFEPEISTDTVNAQGIIIDDAEYVPVLLGNSETLNVTFIPINTTNQNVTWSSSNPAVATVIDGVVYGNSIGTCEITATSEDGGRIATCTASVLSQQENQKIAILFGMADYAGTQNDLNGPVNDMIALEAALERSGYIVFKYMDYGAAELLYRVTDVASKLSPDSTLLFAYSGHGIDGGYLLGADNYGISLYDLKRCLSLHTGVKEIIIDACYSGDLIGKGTKTRSIDVIETQEDFNNYVISVFKNTNTANSFKNFANGEDEYYVITSSSGSQLSYELLFEIQNSPFATGNLAPTIIEGKTYYWLGFFGVAFDDGFGLYNDVPFSQIWANKNSDGFLTWEELYSYIKKTTAQLQQAQVYPENSNHIIWSIKDSANVPVSDLEIGGNILLDNRKPKQIIHTIIPANAENKKVTYASENQDIASISETGLIFGHEPGSTTVTVTTEDGGFTQTATIIVYDSDINGDNKVDMLDIVILAQEYSNDTSELDLNIDGIINLFDIILVAKGIG